MANSAAKDRTKRERATNDILAKGDSPKSGAEDKTQPTKAQGAERRRQIRFSCEGFAEVVVDAAAFLFRGTIQNLSLSGCYIHSPARLRLDRGAEVYLQFTVEGHYFKAHARLMSARSGEGAGFEFDPGDEELQARIKSLLRSFNAPIPVDVLAR